MGIREQGYRHWEGTYSGHAWRWWTITRASLRATVYTKPRLFLLLILIMIAWAVPFLIGLLYYMGALGVGANSLQTPDQRLRRELFDLLKNWQWMWGVVFSAVIGSRLVANDLRSDALYIYLAKPLHRTDYIIGKVLACFLWLIPIVLLPGLWVFLASIGSTSKDVVIKEPWQIFGQTLLVYGVFMLLCASGSILISSLTKRWMIALVSWIAFFFLPIPLASITNRATGDKEWLYLSPWHDVTLWAGRVFEQPTNVLRNPDWAPAGLIVFGLITASLLIFTLRISRLEVSE